MPAMLPTPTPQAGLARQLHENKASPASYEPSKFAKNSLSAFDRIQLYLNCM
jgi:hypothetical protein